MATLNFRTEVQVALYKLELCGQISDGHWENATPTGHYHPWCTCDVAVGEPGRDFYARRESYNFTSRELLEVVSKRMLGYARLTLAYGLEAAKKLEHLAGCDGWDGLPMYEDHEGSTYWADLRAQIEDTLCGLGVTLAAVRDVIESDAVYRLKNLLSDLDEMKKAIKIKK